MDISGPVIRPPISLTATGRDGHGSWRTSQDQLVDTLGMLGGEPECEQPTERVADDRRTIHTDPVE